MEYDWSNKHSTIAFHQRHRNARGRGKFTSFFFLLITFTISDLRRNNFSRMSNEN